jgi:hypothetical protein
MHIYIPYTYISIHIWTYIYAHIYPESIGAPDHRILQLPFTLDMKSCHALEFYSPWKEEKRCGADASVIPKCEDPSVPGDSHSGAFTTGPGHHRKKRTHSEGWPVCPLHTPLLSMDPCTKGLVGRSALFQRWTFSHQINLVAGTSDV